MANRAVTAFTATTTVAETDIIPVVTDPSSAATSKKIAVSDFRSSVLNNLLTTRGDIIYRNATVPARLAVGAAASFVRSDGTDPAYYTTPKARVYRSTNQSINDSTWTAISHDNERYDIGGCWVIGSPTRLTVPAGAGDYYHIAANGSFAASSAGVLRQFAIRLNGATYIALAQAYFGASNSPTTTVGCDYALAAADYVEFMVFQDTGGALNILYGANYTPDFWFHQIA